MTLFKTYFINAENGDFEFSRRGQNDNKFTPPNGISYFFLSCIYVCVCHQQPVISLVIFSVYRVIQYTTRC